MLLGRMSLWRTRRPWAKSSEGLEQIRQLHTEGQREKAGLGGGIAERVHDGRAERLQEEERAFGAREQKPIKPWKYNMRESEGSLMRAARAFSSAATSFSVCASGHRATFANISQKSAAPALAGRLGCAVTSYTSKDRPMRVLTPFTVDLLKNTQSQVGDSFSPICECPAQISLRRYRNFAFVSSSSTRSTRGVYRTGVARVVLEG